jgi:DNA-binding transcriptional regulator YdaS (Cro superfamily)
MSAAELFDRAGRALYGDHFAAPLAQMLGVSKDTVRKWAAGKSDIPRGVFDEIEVAIVFKQAELQRAAVAIFEARPK